MLIRSKLTRADRKDMATESSLLQKQAVLMKDLGKKMSDTDLVSTSGQTVTSIVDILSNIIEKDMEFTSTDFCS